MIYRQQWGPARHAANAAFIAIQAARNGIDTQSFLNFANSFRGTYTGSVPASSFYNSWSGYNDEIAWAAAWVAKATGAASDISTAESIYNSMGMSSAGDYSWDDKKTGVQILMYEITQKDSYKNTVSSNTNSLISSG